MSRILNRQRQLAEQGRLRLGYTLPTEKGVRPVKSETWVLTSHSEEHIQAAATLWGGNVERWQPQGSGVEQWRVITTSAAIDAVLPPGEPLTQAYEQWSRGGCQVRCDGVTEQFSGSPCLCLAKYGGQWHERNTGICDSKSRLKVLLPDMPGLGVWRMETGSYYGTDEIAGMVDTIRAAVGDQVLVPVRLRIEARTRVAGGQTKQFIVPVLELRGVTAGALLAGHLDNAQLGGTANHQQIEAGRPDYAEQAGEASTVDAVRAIWQRASEAGHLTDDLKSTLSTRVEAIKAAVETTATPVAEDGIVDAEVVEEDADALWETILRVAGAQSMTLSQVEEDFAKANAGMLPATASAGELRVYLDTLQERAA